MNLFPKTARGRTLMRVATAALLLHGLLAASARAEVDLAVTAPTEFQARLRDEIGALQAADRTSPPGLVPALAEFYASRDYRPIWHDIDGRLLDKSQGLPGILAQAGLEGLDARTYGADALAAVPAPVEAEADSAAARERLLSSALLRYAHDLRSGQVDPRAVDPEWYIPAANGFDPAAFLQKLVDSTDISAVLNELAPSQPEYARLRAALVRYRAMEAQGGWPLLGEGPKLEIGARDERVPALRQRLSASGDLDAEAAAADALWFDEALVAAVRRFQFRHGLAVDGVVGRHTRAAMNVSAQERVRQIELNMERWRWLPRQRADRHIVVNMVGFELEAVDHGAPVLDMRVIVGRQYRRTPVFSSRLTHLVFNPFWTIPKSIAVKDILPQAQADAEYLTRMNIRVFDGWGADAPELDPLTIDWSTLGPRRFPYKLRQDPGPNNALGSVKFLLPNPYDVYLHDTPSRNLFDRPVRAFSSGCIRVEKPLELIDFVLPPETGWTRAAIEGRIATGRTETVRVPQPVPVYVIYLTAWVDAQGNAHFRDDLYRRDALLARALERVGTGLAYPEM